MTLDSDALAGAADRLKEELQEVSKELAELGISADGVVEVPFDEGFADAAQTTSERSNVLSIAEGLQERVEDVRSALKKLDRGTYGKCENCGNDIDPERLEAIPAARLCISCKQRAS